MNASNRKSYSYEGPVFRFETIINPKWKANTIAVSSKQALNNLSHRYKMSVGLAKDAKITLNEKYLKTI